MVCLGNRDHSVVFETASKSCILDSVVDYGGYFISSKGFLPTVVNIRSFVLNSPIPVHFSSLIPKMWMFTLAISFDHLQFALIHGPNIPGSHAISFFTAAAFTFPPDTPTSGCHLDFGSVSSFFLELFLHSSPVA